MSEYRKSSNYLKELRKAHGYTQDFVASRLEIARQTYSHYETGRRVPPYDVMQRLAALYEISLDELSFNRNDSDKNDTNKSGFIEFFNDPENHQKYRALTRTEKELLYYFKQINENYRWELIEFARILGRKTS